MVVGLSPDSLLAQRDLPNPIDDGETVQVAAHGEEMILTDGVHLVSDESEDELHRFARKVGLTRRRFHGKRKGHPHYDLTGEWTRAKALGAGAQVVSPRRIAEIARRHS